MTINLMIEDQGKHPELQTVLISSGNQTNLTATTKALTATLIESLSSLIEHSGSIEEQEPTNSKANQKESSSVSDQKNSSTGSQNLQEAMALMQGILSELMGRYSEVQEQTQQDQLQVGQAFANASKALNDNSITQTKKEITDNEHKSTWDKVLEALEITAAVVFCASAVFSGDFALAAVIVTMTALSLSGATNDVTNDLGKVITQGLEGLGVSPNVAQDLGKAFAGIVITLVAVAVTFGAAGAAGFLNSFISSGEDAAESSSSLSSSIKSAINGSKGTALMVGSQMLASTNSIADLLEASVANSSNQTTQEVLMVLGEILQTVVVIAGTCGAAYLSGQASEGDVLSKLKGGFSKLSEMLSDASSGDGITASLAQKVQDWANTASQTLENMDLNKARVWSSRLSTLAQVVPAPAQIVTGKIDLDLGSLAEVLSNLRGNITQLGAMMEENQSQMKQAQSITNSTLKSDEQMISDVSEYIAFLQAGTQVLASGI